MLIKKLCTFLFLIFFIVSIFSFNTSAYSENDFQWQNFNFTYYNANQGNICPKLVINCIFPEDIPHSYNPNKWNPYYFESYEEILLDVPNSISSLTGSFEKNKFNIKFTTSKIYPGTYKIQVIENLTKVLFSKEFEMTKNYEGSIVEAEWIIRSNSGSYSYSNIINPSQTNFVEGIKIKFTLKNSGDIPYSVGTQDQKTMPINYSITLSKSNDTDNIFTSNKMKFERNSDSFINQNYNEKCYFKPKETINYSTDISSGFPSLNNFGEGKYHLTGYIELDGFTLNLNSGDILFIGNPDGSPGFEIILLIFAIMLLLFYKKFNN